MTRISIREPLPSILSLISIAYLLTTILLAAGRAYVYRRLTEQTGP